MRQPLPKLRFNNSSRPSWVTLEPQPLGYYYVVGTTNARSNPTMLRLGHENGGTALLPGVIFLEHRAEEHRIIVLSDAAIASEMLGTAVMKALTQNGKTAPSNPRGNVGLTTEIGRQQETTAFKSELNPLLRLLHSDRLKLAKLTNNDATIKMTNPVLLAKIKTSQLNTNLEDLPIMQTHMLTKVLTMTACTPIDYSGPGAKADAWYIAHFLRFERDGVTLRAFKTLKDFQELIDTVEKCFCAIAMETKSDRPFFRDIFRPMRDNFYDSARKTKLDDVPIDWLTYEVATLFNQWAQLYTDTQYAAVDFETFKQLNIAALHFDNKEWRHESNDAESTTTPVQRVNPPTKTVAPPPAAGNYKRGRNATPSNRLPGAKSQRPKQRQALAPAPATPAPPRGAKGVSNQHRTTSPYAYDTYYTAVTPHSSRMAVKCRHPVDEAMQQRSYMQESSRPKTRRMCSRRSPT
jgi:hypothetical protein